MVSLVELFHTHTGSTKVLGCTTCERQAFSLAREGLLVYRDKFNFSPLDYGTIQLHLELDTPCIFQLIDAVVDSFNMIVAKDGIVLNCQGELDGPDTLPAYLEKWRMLLWDLAFSSIFKGVTPFKKSDVFVDYHGSNLLVRRVIYR
jgi:hypothetical protein